MKKWWLLNVACSRPTVNSAASSPLKLGFSTACWNFQRSQNAEKTGHCEKEQGKYLSSYISGQLLFSLFLNYLNMLTVFLGTLASSSTKLKSVLKIKY